MTKKIMKMSNVALSELRKFDKADETSMYLANICVEFDEKYGLGSSLTLDWFMDYYIAMEFNRQVKPKFIEIYEILKDGNHNNRNPIEYFNDNIAYYIPDQKKQIIVMGKYYGPKYLVMNEIIEFSTNIIWNQIYVRMIWPRSRKNCIGSIDHPTLSYYKDHKFEMKFANDGCLYGDCRDPGHVLTYEDRNEYCKADNAHWDMKTPLQWFFEIDCLNTELMEQ